MAQHAAFLVAFPLPVLALLPWGWAIGVPEVGETAADPRSRACTLVDLSLSPHRQPGRFFSASFPIWLARGGALWPLESAPGQLRTRLCGTMPIDSCAVPLGRPCALVL